VFVLVLCRSILESQRRKIHVVVQSMDRPAGNAMTCAVLPSCAALSSSVASLGGLTTGLVCVSLLRILLVVA
jgi:hypothetical protein